MDPTAYEVVHELEEAHWFFVARRRILSRLLDDLLAGVSSTSILDVGCGTGATMSLLERYGKVAGIDISSKALAYCREQGRSRMCLADGQSLPFSDGSFDLVTALDLLEHLEHEDAGLGEAWRVLKNGGYAVLVVPAYQFLWSGFDEFSGHFRRYTREELKRVVEAVGFEVTKLSHFNTLLFPIVGGVRAVKNLLGRRMSSSSDLATPGDGLNALLARVFSAERQLISRADLPFGVSLLCIARKGPSQRGADET
jgi:ubiquinone/menaquinone biosynthesis C-methylase UbiE